MQSLLHFEGYDIPQPGDTITVWRDEWCIGSITWYGNGEVVWRMNIGKHMPHGDCETVDEAKQAIEATWRDWLASVGLIPDPRPSTFTPKDHAAHILRELKLCTASKVMESYMRSTNIQRLLSELSPTERKSVREQAWAIICAKRDEEQKDDAA